MSPSANPVLNKIKEKVSEAYLLGLVAKKGYILEKKPMDTDLFLGFDFSLFNIPAGAPKDRISEANEIKIQLKAVSCGSASMFSETEEHIEYTLSQQVIPIGPNYYLIVIVLPKEDEFESWVTITEEEMVVKRCAYFVKVTDILSPGKIKIPKTNRLSVELLDDLFISNQSQI